MKALTVQQPWAWAIVHGGKTIENRTQLWKYRGPLAIHAGTRLSERGFHHPTYEDAFARATSAVRHRLDVRGAIIGVAQLVDAHVAVPDCCDSPWAEQSYEEHGGRTRRDLVHLVLEDARPVDPIPCKGRLGLWTPPLAVLAQLSESVVLP